MTSGNSRQNKFELLWILLFIVVITLLLHYATNLNQNLFPVCLTTDSKRFLRVDHEFGINFFSCTINGNSGDSTVEERCFNF